MTKAETAEMLLYMAATWPQMEVNEYRQQVLMDHFSEESAELMKKAILHLASREFPPSIKDLKEAVIMLKPKIEKAKMWKLREAPTTQVTREQVLKLGLNPEIWIRKGASNE